MGKTNVCLASQLRRSVVFVGLVVGTAVSASNASTALMAEQVVCDGTDGSADLDCHNSCPRVDFLVSYEAALQVTPSGSMSGYYDDPINHRKGVFVYQGGTMYEYRFTGIEGHC